MEYTGNLKGDALKHYKWKGRRKSTNVMKGGNPHGRRLIELKKERQKEQQKREKRRAIEEEMRAIDEGRRRAIVTERKSAALQKRDRAIEREREIERNNKIKGDKRIEAEKAYKKARKKAHAVKVKGFVRKLANGKVIQVRSFLRRVVKKNK